MKVTTTAALARQHATALNCEGTASLAGKDYGAAVRALTRGLVIVKGLVSERGEEEALQKREPDAASEDEHEALFSFSSATLEMGPSNEGTYVFPSPIAATAPQAASASHSFEGKLSFAILYNLALAHHMWALEGSLGVGSSRSRALLRKAASLYELALAIHRNGDASLTPLQAMAIANNLGDAYARLNYLEASTACFAHLVSLVLCDGGGCERLTQPHVGFEGSVVRCLPKNHGSRAPVA
jgi:hypothetical protein